MDFLTAFPAATPAEDSSDADVLREIGMSDEADDLDEHLGGWF